MTQYKYIKNKYFWVLISILIIIIFALITLVVIKAISNNTIEYGTMSIHIFDVGKADAILITTESGAIMIDTGVNECGQEIVNFLNNHGVTKIDYLIITHFHKDHVGGASTLINNIEVTEVIVPDYGKDSKQYNKFIEAVEQKKLDRIILNELLTFTLDDAVFTIYPPSQPYYDFSNSADSDDDVDVQENNFSLVVTIKHGNNNFLFTGDSQSKRLKELLSLDEIVGIKYDFLKVPHHGEHNNSVIKLITTICPQYAAITCSKNAPADSKVITALEAVGTKVYITTKGNIDCKSDGNKLNISYK